MKKIFTILSIVSVATIANAQNLLTNPGFESDLTGWNAGPGSSYTAPAVLSTDSHSGAKNVGYVGATATTGFYQNVAITEGKTYVISFWYKSSGDDSDSRLWSIFKDAGGSPVYTTDDSSTDQFRTNNGYLPSAASWTKFEAEMPAGAGAVSLDVAVRAYNGGTAYFDDFAAYEKGTMAVSNIQDFDKQVVMNTLVKDQLTFKLPARATVNIYSMDGKLISSNRVDNGGSINTQSWVKGTYIVTVDNGSAKVSRKVIKQ